MSSLKRRIAAGIGSTAIVVAGAVTLAPAASAAPSAPAACSTSNAVSKKAVHNGSMYIELRYSTSSRCAWGRISNSDVGNKVWVDRSSNGGSTWTGPMGMTTQQSGSDTHTPAYDDAGYVMRACGWNGTTVCTGWY
ncbi:DUF2690 domain-containing protein [Streptomyces sp. RKAG293]|uniref:DUF2690 domain-containing protein n=1 Tax=Streptomyces sp. RKAG293 TaxID=2893403 RepID=UPI0020341D6B|nr:DUF2690 domain-containing protein [Streptomyces sp. RKAG293]MCM2418927.1 DUF2690 domain-containing protein [Streptomyces sp. RKAG293]